MNNPVSVSGSSGKKRLLLAGAVVLLVVAALTLGFLISLGILRPSATMPTAVPEVRPTGPASRQPQPTDPKPISTPASTATVTVTASPTPELGTSNLYVEYIIDASGSMTETLPDGSVKITAARQLLKEHIAAFRPETNIGLRAYGHRLPFQDEAKSCQDIELIAPPRPGQMEKIAAWLGGFQPQGMTPLAESLRQALNDFTFEPARINSVVMLSDGIETCGGDPCKLVETLKAKGINFTIHVIGLGVDDKTKTQLSCVAKAGDGQYYDARSGQDVSQALGTIHSTVAMDEVIVPHGVSTPTRLPLSTIPARAATPTTAPGYTTYINEEVGFALDYPASWYEYSVSADYAILQSFDSAMRQASQFGWQDGDVKVDISVQPARGATSLKAYLDGNRSPDANILSEEWLLLANGVPGVIRQVSSSMGQNIYFMTMVGEVIVTVAVYGDLTPPDDALRILRSFRLTHDHQQVGPRSEEQGACISGVFYSRGETQGRLYYSLLRFYSDGLVLRTSVAPSDGDDLGRSWSKIGVWFNRESLASNRSFGSGEYSLLGRDLTFSITFQTGTIGFGGTYLGTNMTLHSRSQITGFEETRTYDRFSLVESDSQTCR